MKEFSGEITRVALDESLRDARTLVIQLRDRISDLIRQEGLKPGDKMPTEAQLTGRFKISRAAVREALKLLEQDDLIYVEHGRGRFVSAIAAVQVDRPITAFESVTEMTRHYGYTLENRILSISEEEPDVTLRERLRLEPTDRVIRIERLRLETSDPIIYCIDFVPRSLIPGALDKTDWSGSLLALLALHKQRPRMSSAQVTAVMLPDDVIERHDLTSFGPALLITETCYTVTGNPVIYAIDYHRGSHFSFSLVRK